MLERGQRNSGAQIYLISTLLMFALATLHIVTAAVLTGVDLGLAFFRFILEDQLPTSKTSLGGIPTVYCIVAWIGDFLVIYRCYYVWNKNIWIVALPSLLVLSCIGINIYVLWWFTHPNAGVSFTASMALNSITTALIALKFYKQHQISTCHGIVDRSSKLSLMRILRIIVESAMLYTVQLTVLIILYYTNSNGEVIVQFAIVPSVGIVFILISLRVHMAKSNSSLLATGLGTIPEWLVQDDKATQYHNATSLTPGVVNFRVSQNGHLDDAYSGPFSPSSYPHKNRRSVKSLSRDSNTL
ncbi:hypothetical protein CVT25_007110 [Psilocybe cyanescens]|uniref:Uncharacterized protein n=1 Tax=Psilocybe cyanescens TaxID=93625 RepID=A0A409WVW1_PSICY|nr:hypothetical protein CVT25_007110 [Psilocybe cyanescens]